jgi:hypothetical protein
MIPIFKKHAAVLCLALLPAAGLLPGASGPPRRVAVLRVPQGGIQPQVAVDGKGVVHMIYFAGDPAHGDLYYVRSRDAGSSFSRPLQVNSQPGSAIAVGNIRGARLAIGRNGRVHVAWNGSGQAAPKGPAGAGAPMLYTRLNEAGTAFEPQRNVIQSAWGIDGGGAVAADASGYVYVFWHAPAPGSKGEENRRVWMARSRDGGTTFERERAVFDQPTGACACCGLDAFADKNGNVYVLYRAATEMVHRDMYLIVSENKGNSFHGADISRWNVGYCVMSSEAFSESAAGVLAAWETQKQVYFAQIDPATRKVLQIIPAPGSGDNRKYPALAGNAQGETILAWTEGMSWNKGGSLAWQVFDKSGRPEGEAGRAEGVPAWSLVAAFTRPDGGFTVVY